MDLVRAKGLFSFYQDGHQECCRVRKVGCSHSGDMISSCRHAKACARVFATASSTLSSVHVFTATSSGQMFTILLFLCSQTGGRKKLQTKMSTPACSALASDRHIHCLKGGVL
eukprot:1152861-Pelagomonas_calceolata.AAC.4